MWNIHGKTYNLHSFLNKHPGGRAILEASIGNDDLTATFESYHAFSDMDKIKLIMKNYEVAECNPSKISFKSDGFYRILQNRVKYVLKNNTKSNLCWIIKISIQTIIFIISFFITFYFHSINIIYRIGSAFIAAHMLLQIGFCGMHDASHMAISNNKNTNELISKVWNSIALWDNQLWIQHHVIRHHAFTGDYKMDPDIIHFKPFIRKSNKISHKGYLNISKRYPILIALFTICIFPGMFVGQGIMYHFIWIKKKFLWKMNLSKMYNISIWQIILKLFIIFSFIYGRSISILFAYAICSNITYAVCILPDHDTFETTQNHINYTEGIDWGEIQVKNSGNFCTQKPWFSSLFGGINYQIEHHLFPTLCHVHFHKIKPIVKLTCKEFGIPYVCHDSFFGAINSTLKHYSISSKEDI